ncbi:hypothetical protein NDU88_009726 [Pleurodeles waltl]|uniref:Uncharacterized protein n=1 Tax=Pleurodeles waltl TaxID=8319 RepID=A0AAV7S186_PLEWA|nr:hypothetical protein NDU88_009726 [Pleurodeles waltl]
MRIAPLSTAIQEKEDISNTRFSQLRQRCTAQAHHGTATSQEGVTTSHHPARSDAVLCTADLYAERDALQAAKRLVLIEACTFYQEDAAGEAPQFVASKEWSLGITIGESSFFGETTTKLTTCDTNELVLSLRADRLMEYSPAFGGLAEPEWSKTITGETGRCTGVSVSTNREAFGDTFTAQDIGNVSGPISGSVALPFTFIATEVFFLK